MTVHVGEVLSEVSAAAPGGSSPAGPALGADEWEERARLADLLDRLQRDRLRTATEPDGG
jgi:hypothetical protein